MRIKSLLSIILIGICLTFSSCEESETSPAQISFDIPATGYTISLGETIEIKPNIISPDKVSNQWIEDGKIISEEGILKYTSMKKGIHIIKYVAINNAGESSISINIEVLGVDAPQINIEEPSNGFITKQSKSLMISAKIKSSKTCTYSWTEDGKELSKNLSLNYINEKLGKHTIVFSANNIGGKSEKTIEIEVVTLPVPVVTFPGKQTSYKAKTGEVFNISPTVSSEGKATYSWILNNKEIAKTKDLSYTPTENGLDKLIFKAKNIGGEASYVIKLLIGLRETLPESDMKVNKVYEYTPAPGQFVNESFSFNTMEEANTKALEWLTKTDGFVTLGGFGGYVVFGFDHSIIDKEGKDIMIMGNSFTGPSGCSCEPGIISVMQDKNGNGLPDDTWYELKGGNYDDPTTIKGYEVTYFKPTAPSQNVTWKDNQGNEGWIDYMEQFHTQDYYYPLWINTDSYTLSGTRLEDRTSQNPETGFWTNRPFSDGYVDNYVLQPGEVDTEIHYENQYGGNKFELKNAIDKNGNPVELGFVDFFKVHNAVNVKAGWLGENSTEVYYVNDVK